MGGETEQRSILILISLQTKPNSRWLDGELCGESNCKLAQSNCVTHSLKFTLNVGWVFSSWMGQVTNATFFVACILSVQVLLWEEGTGG